MLPALLFFFLSCNGTHTLFPVYVNGSYGLIDRKGRVRAPASFEAVGAFSEGLAPVVINGKGGFIDERAVTVILPRFRRVGSFSEGLALAGIKGKIGYINHKGNWVIPPRYSRGNSFSSGAASVVLQDAQGKIRKLYINKKGIPLFSHSFDFSSDFRDGRALVVKNGRWGYIDLSGKIVIPLDYDFAGDFSEGLAPVKKNGHTGYINPEGKVVIDFLYTDGGAFSEGLAPVSRKENINSDTGTETRLRIGYITPEGKIKIPFRFTSALGFRENAAMVEENGLFAVINTQGDRLTRPSFKQVRSFHGGLALVLKGDREMYITKRGRSIWTSDPLPLNRAQQDSPFFSLLLRRGIEEPS